MLTLVIESEAQKERIEKALTGFLPFDMGEIEINDREDGQYEIYLGEESENDVVAYLED